jgi:hypothetical protein
VPNLNQDGEDLILGGYEGGFFKAGSGKVGILRNGCDDPSVWDGSAGINSLLDLIGVPASGRVEFTLKCSATRDASQYTAALLQFKEAKVDKIISAEGGGAAWTIMQQPLRQHYNPACNDIYTSAGLPAMKNEQTDLVSMYLCETTLDAMQIADKVKGPFTQASYAAASVNAGWLFSAQTWGIDYTGSRAPPEEV